jgi:hypothetical protein
MVHLRTKGNRYEKRFVPETRFRDLLFSQTLITSTSSN